MIIDDDLIITSSTFDDTKFWYIVSSKMFKKCYENEHFANEWYSCHDVFAPKLTDDPQEARDWFLMRVLEGKIKYD